MRKLLLSFCVFYFSASFAQPQQADILRFKISKTTVTYGSDNVYEYYYDETGKDTALYINGQLSYSLKHEHDNKGRVIRTIKNGISGEMETTEYKYSPDGSFTAENKDKQFGMVVKETYDKQGRLVKKVIPDGSQYMYSYDGKGKLIRVASVPSMDGIKFTTNYAYNAKGQLIAAKTSGEYAWSEKYIYNVKGLLISSELINTLDGSKEVTLKKYEYEFR